MYEWYPYPKTRPTESGDYLILFDANDDKEVIAEVATFFEIGDIFASGCSSAIGGTPEERFMDAILNHSLKIEKSGFYAQRPNEEKFWELKPIFWAYLPEPPEGYKYN